MTGMTRDQKARWLHDLPARSALKITNQRHVRMWLAGKHSQALHRHSGALRSLSAADARIVAALDTHGVYMTTLDELSLPGSQALLAQAGELASAFAEEARALASQGTEFIIVPPSDIVRNPWIYRWGVQERLLNIAEAYLGLPVAYDGVAINYTVADGRAISTRKWHRDWEDRRMLKIAVYLHDVDTDGGPFELIARADTLQNDRDGFTYELADDAELERRLGASFQNDVVSCVGPRGTVVFSDTARFFHRGKPATRRDRAALFYSYFANPPRHPFLCERTGLSRKDIAQMARFLPPRQRKAALWRRQLSLLLRMIPPAGL
ncbi:hypothetical protein EDF56_102491 [Novosphingobium sp. PhB165]|uniref:hypothetical protein n=1 Tax=Novosphingobium sp. PhB165 TaxID=2485105 RepID=UPI00104E9810|nr:hypothetical protein [Novosphingobium sp. PhB165]TCM20828.1 hypothetical protein EDF56_102491 [Novosphingobium sp. PhB165]